MFIYIEYRSYKGLTLSISYMSSPLSLIEYCSYKGLTLNKLETIICFETS